MAKLERLLNLTAALLDTERPLSADEIRRRIGYGAAGTAFHRTFERDKDDLREMGIPLRVEPIPGTDPPLDGYRIDRAEYYLADPGLEPDELAAIHLAATAVRLRGVQGAEALWKLGGTPDATRSDLIQPMADLPDDPNLGPVFEAVNQRQVLHFRYRDADRELEPHRLDYRRGRWYLTGLERTRGEERNYRVDRIEGQVLTGEPHGFEPPPAAPSTTDRPPWLLGDDTETIAHLLVDADQADWAVHHVGPDHVVERRTDGSILLDVPVTNRHAFRSFVLTFLEHAEVLGPDDLRAEMISWLESLA
ncbi:MAG: WYL domain-containing protein [Actinomycetia bacterium]|nr:WYL domain-containing protein [Actinomycetes bacterium]